MSRIDRTSQIIVNTLWQEINNAIIQSQSIRSLVQQLNTMGVIDRIIHEEGHVSMEALVEEILEKDDCNTSPSKIKKNSDNPSDKFNLNSDGSNSRDILEELEDSCINELKCSNQVIDGRKLSENEIKFHEFYARQFDETQWLKKVGISI